MKSSQELLHWLEQGRGARGVWRVVLVFAGVLLTCVYSWRQFHGISTEFVMQQAVMARQLARGEGFTTLVNYPQTYAILHARGTGFSEKQAYPEVSHAPFYATVLAAGFAVTPDSLWGSRPATPGSDSFDGWGPDYVILGINLLLFWIGIWLVWRLARRLFDERAAWVSAMASVVSVALWQQTVALTGLPLLMVLLLAVFDLLASLEEKLSDQVDFSRRAIFMVGGLGGLTGLLFLSDYSAGLVAVVVGGYLV